MTASGMGLLDFVDVLIRHLGADVNHVSSTDGDTALHRAACKGHPDVCQRLLIAGANATQQIRCGALAGQQSKLQNGNHLGTGWPIPRLVLQITILHTGVPLLRQQPFCTKLKELIVARSSMLVLSGNMLQSQNFLSSPEAISASSADRHVPARQWKYCGCPATCTVILIILQSSLDCEACPKASC